MSKQVKYTPPLHIRAIRLGICPGCREKGTFIDLKSEKMDLVVHICSNCDEMFAIFNFSEVSTARGAAESSRLIHEFLNRG